MLKNTMLITALFLSSLSFAQLNLPRESSFSQVKQTIGLTTVDLAYSRPNVKDRTILGGVVSYNEIWRTGANENTTLDFSSDVLVDGQALPKGKYSIYTKFDRQFVEVYFYKKNDNWGNPEKWDENQVALKLKPRHYRANAFVESFTIDFSDVTTEEAKLNLSWGETMLTLTITTPTHQTALDEIRSKVNENSSARDLYSAANYYFMKGIELQQAKKMVQNAIAKSGENVPTYFTELLEKINKKLK